MLGMFSMSLLHSNEILKKNDTARQSRVTLNSQNT